MADLDLLESLDRKNGRLIAELEQSEFCLRFFSPATPTAEIEALTAGILREVHGYGGHLTGAISTALGRLASEATWQPWVRPLMESLLAEVTHPQMAGQDAAQLTRSAEGVSGHPASPAAFAVAAIARMLCTDSHPLCHLGFFYLLEGTNSMIAPPMQEVLKSRGITSPFIALHAAEDMKHTDQLREIIAQIVKREPAMAAEIEYGFDCFAVVYPMPVWTMALNSALAAGRSA